MNIAAIKFFVKKNVRWYVCAGFFLILVGVGLVIMERLYITILPREIFMKQHSLLTGLAAVETIGGVPTLHWYRIRDGLEQVMVGSYTYRFTRSDEAMVADRYSTTTERQDIFLINPVKVNKISAKDMPGLVSEILPSSNGLYVVIKGVSATGTPYICVTKRNVAKLNPNCDYIQRLEKKVSPESVIKDVRWSPHRQAELQVQMTTKYGVEWWSYLPTTRQFSRASTSSDQNFEQKNYGSQSRQLTVKRLGFFWRISDAKTARDFYVIAPSKSEFLPLQNDYLLQRVGRNIFVLDPQSRTATLLASPPADVEKITVW